MTAPVPSPATSTAEGPHGGVEYLLTHSLTDSAAPAGGATVFVHGLAGSIADTRPYGSGVAGRRAFLHLRGHGATAMPTRADGAPDAGTYADLADEVEAVVRATGARQGLGVSLGAGALLALLASRPQALDRAVLVLPAWPRPGGAQAAAAVIQRLLAMADAVELPDLDGLARLLREHQPAAVRALPAVGVWSRRRAAELAGTPVSVMLRAFAAQSPLDDVAALGTVKARTLVVAQTGDDAHPLEAARALADALPRCDLHTMPEGGIPWRSRTAVRAVVAGFLTGRP